MRKPTTYIVRYPFYDQRAQRTVLANGLVIDHLVDGKRIVWDEDFVVVRDDLRGVSDEEIAAMSRDEVLRGEREYLLRHADKYGNGFDEELDATVVEAQRIANTLLVRWRGWYRKAGRRQHVALVEVLFTNAYTNNLGNAQQTKLFDQGDSYDVEAKAQRYYDQLRQAMRQSVADDA
ncbi:MAG: hypothetical protein D6683_01560 [Actinomyces sp.]|nr:MAG: hypothetical protein D6683_01560 [Actinomyces sp.]